MVEASWNVMAHAQKPDFVYRRNGRVHLNRRGRQFGRLVAAEVCASAVVILDTPCSEVVWRVLATHSIRQFPLHFPSRASSCAVTFHLESTIFASRPPFFVTDMRHKSWKWMCSFFTQGRTRYSLSHSVRTLNLLILCVWEKEVRNFLLARNHTGDV